MQRARKWLQTTFFNRSDHCHSQGRQTPISPLPDDILLLIFENLAPKDRLPIRLVSRKFRDLELEKGGRTFQCITIILNEDKDEIVADFPARGCYCFETTPNGDFETKTPAIYKLFLGAVTYRLQISVVANREAIASQSLLSLIQLIDCEEMFVYFNCTTDYSDFFNNLNSNSLKYVTFNWKFLKGQNQQRMLEALQHLPKLDLLHVADDAYTRSIRTDDPESFLLNGPMMLAIIGIASRVDLQLVHCTAQDLLDAFQKVCDSNDFNQKVQIYAVDSAVDHLLALAEEQGFLVIGRFVMDFVRGYEMGVSSLKDDCRELATEFDKKLRRFVPSAVTVYTCKSEANQIKCRYTDVLDQKRVVLKNRCRDEDFINANWMTSPAADATKYICTYAPLKETQEDFWHMCFTESVSLIVMLCDYKEGSDLEKCSHYFPRESWRDTQIRSVQSDNDEEAEGAGDRRYIVHWDGDKVMGPRAPQRLPGGGAQFGGNRSTFVGIELAHYRISTNPDVDMLDVVKELRRTRYTAIESHVQFLYLHCLELDSFVDEQSVEPYEPTDSYFVSKYRTHTAKRTARIQSLKAAAPPPPREDEPMDSFESEV